MSLGFTIDLNLTKRILNNLDDASLLNACQTNETFRQICNTPEFWRERLLTFYPEARDAQQHGLSNKDFYFLLQRYSPFNQENVNKAYREGNQIALQMLANLGWTPNTEPINSRFMAPQRFVQDLVDFFNNVNLGTVNDQPLQNYLYFLQPEINGQPNPLYGIIRSGLLVKLFTRYARVNPSAKLTPSRLIASQEMRQYLGDVMRNTIDTQVLNVSHRHPELRDQLIQKGEELKMAINNPNMQVEPIANINLFNPNSFPYAAFSALISLARAQGEYTLTEEELESLRRPVNMVYKDLPEFQGREASLETVFEAQTNAINQ